MEMKSMPNDTDPQRVSPINPEEGKRTLPQEGLETLSKRLVEGRGIILSQWEKVQAGESRINFDEAVKRWITIMKEYYQGRGTGCAASLAGEPCTETPEPLPLCWHCDAFEEPPLEARTSEDRTETEHTKQPPQEADGDDPELKEPDPGEA